MLRGKDGNQRLRVVRVLLDRTKRFPVGGRMVKTAVVRDSVTDLRSGQRIEKTIDYFAQDRAGGVHYFGEDVNEYEHGRLVGHSGEWRVGRDVKRPGLLMPGHPKVGDTFFSEKIPGVAVEKDKVVASGLTKKVHGQTYQRVIRIREHATTPKPAEFELKTYAPGTGVITEANGGLGLVELQLGRRAGQPTASRRSAARAVPWAARSRSPIFSSLAPRSSSLSRRSIAPVSSSGSWP